VTSFAIIFWKLVTYFPIFYAFDLKMVAIDLLIKNWERKTKYSGEATIMLLLDNVL